MNFHGKKILFISVKTFGYEKHICNKLIELGADVQYFDERPSNTIFVKGIIRVYNNLYSIKIARYYQGISKKILKNRFDFLFVIKGEVVPNSFIVNFKLLNPSCKLIFYTWDSFKNNPNGLNVLPLFDEKFTFDKSDSIKYNISFRPLFFIDQYGKLRGVNNLHKTNQNLLFVGTAHTDRYLISNIIVSWCKKNKINTNTYYFIPGLMVFFFKKIFDKSFSGFNYNSLSVKPLSIEQLLQLYKTATIILDIHHPDQSGLTMRTFEALGAGKKLITTNAFIKEYFFFNENNILIIERNQTEFNYDFFLSPVKF